MTRTLSRRGAALAATLAVLVILTILVTGLAGSHRVTQRQRLVDADRQAVSGLVEVALGRAMGRLGAGAGAAAAEAPLALAQGSVTYDAKLLDAEDELYQGGFLSHRAGDAKVNVWVAVPANGPVRSCVERTYLANSTAAGRRVIQIGERALASPPWKP